MLLTWAHVQVRGATKNVLCVPNRLIVYLKELCPCAIVIHTFVWMCAELRAAVQTSYYKNCVLCCVLKCFDLGLSLSLLPDEE